MFPLSPSIEEYYIAMTWLVLRWKRSARWLVYTGPLCPGRVDTGLVAASSRPAANPTYSQTSLEAATPCFR